jgi:AbrB family looped-hinge helix DNA binding protein
MATTLTSKGQVTVPKKIRDALHLAPGSAVEFAVNDAGEVVLRKAGRKIAVKQNRFEALRGTAQIKWDTDELMKLLRG